MSNAIRYDSLLVRDLAAELDRVLRNARLDAAFLDRDQLTVTLVTRASQRLATSPPSLRWHLHPDSGHLTRAPGIGRRNARGGNASDVPGGRIQLNAGSRVVRVDSPADERVIMVHLDAGDTAAGFVRTLVIELVTNQWNALALGADDRIMAVLRERQTHGRVLRAGVAYEVPSHAPRAGAAAPLTFPEWCSLLADVPPGERLRAVLRAAWMSPLNAPMILGDADVSADSASLERAWQRYVRMTGEDARVAVLLEEDGRLQPYSVDRTRIPGASESPRVMESLLAAFEAAAAPSTGDAADVTHQAEQSLALVARRIEAVDRRMERLQEEADGAAVEAAALRARADLLMSRLHVVKRGMSEVELEDFEGGTVTIELDAALTAPANAARLYDSARRRDRAAARVPALLERAARERARLEELAARVRDGSADAEELAKLRVADRSAERDAPSLPYREYRTGSGLEVRVGRGARANDALTFRHSAPTDIWLHARDVAGAHVILRWSKTDANPPARDVAEAAILAALFSRARTSGVVPVDWTRRKHVRKPRKAAPGLVLPERVRTVFVEPDTAAEERMRVT